MYQVSGVWGYGVTCVRVFFASFFPCATFKLAEKKVVYDKEPAVSGGVGGGGGEGEGLFSTSAVAPPPPPSS